MYGLDTIKRLKAEARRREEQELKEDRKVEAYCSGRKVA